MRLERIKNFEELGFGMFVHFGLFSLVGKGEWYYWCGQDCDKKYYFSEEFANKFNPKKDWAIELVKQAKAAGMKYITLTTKHHEGYCLFDTKGLTNWDSMNLGPRRDLVKEFVDACRQEGIVPFLYHALLDWHHPEYRKDFHAYNQYLISCIKLLCTNYGEIGGFWFDGFWDRPNDNWEFDELYSTIRKYQPNAMIINNSGMSNRGAILSPEIDSVTYERGNPTKIESTDGKERAGEMCEVFGYHWGYAFNDFDRKPFKQILSSLITCRYCNCNMLLNVGPLGDGSIYVEDQIYLNHLGQWIRNNDNFIYKVKNANVESENCKVLCDEEYLYIVVENVPMDADANVQLNTGATPIAKIKGYDLSNGIYLDNGEQVSLADTKDSFKIKPFYYGESYYARVVKIKKQF